MKYGFTSNEIYTCIGQCKLYQGRSRDGYSGREPASTDDLT